MIFYVINLSWDSKIIKQTERRWRELALQIRSRGLFLENLNFIHADPRPLFPIFLVSTSFFDNLWILRQFQHLENHLSTFSFFLLLVFFFGENIN